MKAVAVYCGSSFGTDKDFEINARALGQRLAKENIELIYGGADIGLMGAIANGVLEMGGNVTGILPEFLATKEIAHKGLTKLITVDTMHERKKIMSDMCDGVITLPGGFGTMEELFEMLTWGQLNLHQKPIGILNINGFYDELISFMETMVEKQLLRKHNREMVIIDNSIDRLLEKMISK